MGLWDNVDLRWLVLPNKCCNSILFYIWRVIYAVYIAVLFYLSDQSFKPENRLPMSLKYLTIWGALFVTLSAVGLLVFHILTGFGSYVDDFFRNLKGCGLQLARLVYLVTEIGVTLQLLIPILYWVAIHPALTAEQRPVGYDLFISINLHGVFGVLIMLDYLFSQIDVVKSHLWVQQTFVIGYIIFNYWYTVNYGLIYPIITWDNAFTYIFIGIALLLSACGFYLCAIAGGALVLMALRSATWIETASADPADPVPGWEEEAIFMLFIFGAGLVFFYVTEKIGEIKDGRKRFSQRVPKNTREWPPRQEYIELPIQMQACVLNQPASERLNYL